MEDLEFGETLLANALYTAVTVRLRAHSGFIGGHRFDVVRR